MHAYACMKVLEKVEWMGEPHVTLTRMACVSKKLGSIL